MLTKTKIFLALLLLPSILAELLSGSSPPLEFFNFLASLFWIFLYGFGVLLIREFKIKWNLQWSIIFLAFAYAIIEEGLTTKALFNVNWMDIGVYANYAPLFGIYVPWSILLLTFHITISTLLPILIVDLSWPKYKNKPLLNKGGTVFCFLGLILISIIGFLKFGTIVGNEMVPFFPSIGLVVGCIVIIIILITCAYIFKKYRIQTTLRVFKPNTIVILSFLFLIGIINIPYILAVKNIPQFFLVIYQLMMITILFCFFVFQMLNKNIKTIHKVSLVYGVIIYFCFYSLFLELNGMLFMSLVGVVTYLILCKWKKWVLINLEKA